MANLNIAIEILANDKASGPLGRIKQALGGVGTVGTALITGAAGIAAGLAGIGVAGTKMAMDMESQMSGIAAVLGTTRDEIAPLGDLIQELGLNPNLKVTAGEAAAAIEMLARNGLDMTEILDGAAESTVLLANATGSDFGNAANIATDAMGIFGIEAANMNEAVNGIVAVTTNSKFTIDDFALALAQGGGVASAVGVSFDDFNTTIAAISPLFKSGSDAGTSLKTMLTRLIPSSSAASDAMYELGLITEDGANQFFDAQGNMKDMADIAGLLSGAMSGLTEEQKTATLSTIFGADAMRAAVGLANTGEEAFRDLAGQMGQTDAMESAATRMDNLAGVMEILQGIGEALMLSIGNGLLPVFRLFADQALALADQVLPKINSGIELVSGIITSFSNNLREGMSPLDAFIEAIWDIAPPALLDKLVNFRDVILPGLIIQITNITSAVIAFIAPIADWIGQNVQLSDVLTAVGIVVASVVVPAILSVVAAAAPLILTFAAIVAAVALVRTAWEENWGGIQEKTKAAWDFIRPLLQAAWDWLKVQVPAALESLRAFWVDRAWPAIQSAVQIVWPILQTIFTSIKDFINNTLIPTVTDLYEKWSTAWSTMQTVLENVWTIVEAVWTEIGRWINDNIVPWVEYLNEVWSETVWPAIQDAVEKVWNVVEPIWESLRSWLAETLPPVINELQATFETVMAGISAAVSPVKSLWDGFVGAVKGFWNWISNKVFNFKISLPDLPDWAIPGSPLPIHTAWKNFSVEMERIGSSGGLAAAPAVALSSGSGSGAMYVFNVDARGTDGPTVDRLRQIIRDELSRGGRSADVRIRTG